LAVVGLGFLAAGRTGPQAAPWFFGALAVYVPVCVGLALLGPRLPLPPSSIAMIGASETRTGLLIILMFPGMGALAMLDGIHLGNDQARNTLIGGSLVAGAALVLAVGRGAGLFRDWRSWLLPCGACALCLFGLADGVNAVADPTPPKLYYGQVADLYASRGKSTTYYVDLKFDNGQDDRERISRTLYQRLQLGQRACIAARPGALQLAWYDVETC
jgi:hypothetical protein